MPPARTPLRLAAVGLLTQAGTGPSAPVKAAEIRAGSRCRQVPRDGEAKQALASGIERVSGDGVAKEFSSFAWRAGLESRRARGRLAALLDRARLDRRDHDGGRPLAFGLRSGSQRAGQPPAALLRRARSGRQGAQDLRPAAAQPNDGRRPRARRLLRCPGSAALDYIAAADRSEGPRRGQGGADRRRAGDARQRSKPRPRSSPTSTSIRT